VVEKYSDANLVAKVLGLSGWKQISDLDLVEKVSEGLPASSVKAITTRFNLDQSIVYKIVPKATLARRAQSQRLSKSQSDKVLAVTRVFQRLLRIYHNDADTVARFLERPHPLLDGKRPIDLATGTVAGADLVLDLLERADAGMAV
jgi:putative toxin-antitoxin system antitoxin component (TIGR02293 family)